MAVRMSPTYVPLRGVVQANIPSRSMFALQTGFKLMSGLFPTFIDVIPILYARSYLKITRTDLMIADSAS